MKLDCLSDDCDGEIPVDYSAIGEIVACPGCGAQYSVCYDESWDGVDESQYWWLEAAQ